MTIGTVMMWACMILFGMLAVGFVLCIVFSVVALVNQWRDKEMMLMWSIMLLISVGCCTGLVFAVIAIGRNLL